MANHYNWDKLKHGHNRRGRTTGTYYSWQSMLSRCRNPKDPAYRHYGGRGIVVCVRWLKFENFLCDMGQKPDGLTLERKNNNKGYNPLNCVWATRKQQASNRRSTRLITINGVTLTHSDWCRRAGIKTNVACMREKYGWSIQKIFNQKSNV